MSLITRRIHDTMDKQMTRDYARSHVTEIYAQVDFVGRAIDKIAFENGQDPEKITINKKSEELECELLQVCNLLKKAENKLNEYITRGNRLEIESLFDIHNSINRLVQLIERILFCLLLYYLEAFESKYGLRNELHHLK